MNRSNMPVGQSQSAAGNPVWQGSIRSDQLLIVALVGPGELLFAELSAQQSHEQLRKKLAFLLRQKGNTPTLALFLLFHGKAWQQAPGSFAWPEKLLLNIKKGLKFKNKVRYLNLKQEQAVDLSITMEGMFKPVFEFTESDNSYRIAGEEFKLSG